MLPPPGLGLSRASEASHDVLSSMTSGSAKATSTAMQMVTSAMISGSTGSIDSIPAATSTIMAHVATATMVSAGSAHGPKNDAGGGDCELLGPFSLVIQAALGLLALSSLVWKRYRERPRRPIKVWSFDVSKQVVGSGLLHIANLLMSMLSAGKLSVNMKAVESIAEEYKPNPCSFYLLNLGIDVGYSDMVL